MANNIGWGEGNKNNTIGWGKAACNNTIGWGIRYLANVVKSGCGGLIPSFALNFDTIASDFTFTRNSFATRVNENGLIETVTNLGSEQVVNGDFTDGTNNWTVAGGGAISVVNEQLIIEGDNDFNFYARQSVLGFEVGKTYQLKIDVAGGTTSRMFVSIFGESTIIDESPIVLGENTVNFTIINGSDGSRFLDIVNRNDDGVGDTLIINSVSVQEVIEDDIPRIDYSTGEAAFLLEPQSTNEIAYSEDFSDSYWTKLGAPTITDNYGTSPDGTQNSTRVQGNSSTAIYVSNGAATTNFSRSIYVKATSGSGNIQALSHNNNTNNVFSIDENWQRIDINSLTNPTGDAVVYALDMRGASTDIFDVEIWGCQEERGKDYATSYIPTEGSTVTRSGETCKDATPTINSEEGVLYAEISALVENDGVRLISLNDGTTGNIVQIYYSGSANKIICQTKVSGSTQSSLQYVVSSQTDIHKVAFKYKENDFALWVDGVEVDTDLVGSVWAEGTLTELDFDIGTGSLPFYGRTKDLKVYDKALTDEELTELTTI